MVAARYRLGGDRAMWGSLVLGTARSSGSDDSVWQRMIGTVTASYGQRTAAVRNRELEQYATKTYHYRFLTEGVEGFLPLLRCERE